MGQTDAPADRPKDASSYQDQQRTGPPSGRPHGLPPPATDPCPKSTGGKLLAEISTAFVAMLRDFYGRGPMRAKTYALDDMIVIVLRDSGYSPVERTMIDSGQSDRVVDMREEFQSVMASQYRAVIESLTDRSVLAFISQAHVDPEITIEMFFLDRPLDGYGTLEVTGKQP